MKNEPEFFPIQSLTFDPELQVRVKINEDAIADYSEQMQTEEEMKNFPPVEVYYDGTRYWFANAYIANVTPEMASQWLTQNRFNRAQRPDLVADYVRQIRDGR